MNKATGGHVEEGLESPGLYVNWGLTFKTFFSTLKLKAYQHDDAEIQKTYFVTP